jgi:hypothetical protein
MVTSKSSIECIRKCFLVTAFVLAALVFQTSYTTEEYYIHTSANIKETLEMICSLYEKYPQECTENMHLLHDFHTTISQEHTPDVLFLVALYDTITSFGTQKIPYDQQQLTTLLQAWKEITNQNSKLFFLLEYDATQVSLRAPRPSALGPLPQTSQEIAAAIEDALSKLDLSSTATFDGYLNAPLHIIYPPSAPIYFNNTNTGTPDHFDDIIEVSGGNPGTAELGTLTINDAMAFTGIGLGNNNYIAVSGAVPPASPTIQAAGPGADVGLEITSKGAGNLTLDSGPGGSVTVGANSTTITVGNPTSTTTISGTINFAISSFGLIGATYINSYLPAGFTPADYGPTIIGNALNPLSFTSVNGPTFINAIDPLGVGFGDTTIGTNSKTTTVEGTVNINTALAGTGITTIGRIGSDTEVIGNININSAAPNTGTISIGNNTIATTIDLKGAIFIGNGDDDAKDVIINSGENADVDSSANSEKSILGNPWSTATTQIVSGAGGIQLISTGGDLSAIHLSAPLNGGISLSAGEAGISLDSTGTTFINASILDGNVIIGVDDQSVGLGGLVDLIEVDLASAATIVPTSTLQGLTGSTNITEIDTTYPVGQLLTLYVLTGEGPITITNGNHIQLDPVHGGTYTLTADVNTISFWFDGTNWRELTSSITPISNLVVNGTTTLTGLTDINITGTANTNINTGTNTGNVAIGSANAGAITIDSGSTIGVGSTATTGVTIGNTANNSTVTVNSGTGAIAVANDNGARNINIATAGTGVKTISIGTSTEANVVTVGSTTGAAQTTLQAGTAGISVDSSGVATLGGTNATSVTVGHANSNVSMLSGTGTINIDSTTGTIGIGTLANARTINIGTGAAGQTINIGSDAANTGPITIGNTNGGAAILNSGSTIDIGDASAGAITINSGSTIGVGSTATTGVIIGNTANNSTVTVNSGTGTIAVANDNGARNINIATAGTGVKTISIGTSAQANIVTVGSTTGAAQTTLQAGTAGISVDSSGAATLGGTNATSVTVGHANSNVSMLSGTGTINIDSTTGTIGIGTLANARTINIGTGAAAQTINIGSDTANTGPTTIGNTNGGAVTVNSGSTIDIGDASAGAITVNSNSTITLSQNDKSTIIGGDLRFSQGGDLTVAANTITVTRSFHFVNGSGGNIATINGGNAAGQWLVLSRTTSDATFVKTGNIKLKAATSVTLTTDQTLTLIYDGSNWLEICNTGTEV